MAVKDYYNLLQVDKNANADEIKKSFHRLALLYHPDLNTNNASEELFKEINEAYQCLSDAQKRSKYDLGIGWFNHTSDEPEPYIRAEISDTEIKLNQEFEITYTYSGKGQFFKKPESKSFLFTSGPIVNHHNSRFNINTVRQTSLTYTVSAIKTGHVFFDAATIEIKNKHFVSNTNTIVVHSNQCYFRSDMEAGDEPVIIKLHRVQFTSSSIYRKTFNYRHSVLVPRSNYAAFYHRVGAIMKGVFAVCGCVLFGLKDMSLIIGVVSGSLVGGIACQTMYWMSGIKPKHFYAYRNPVVLKYLEQDYQLGNNSIDLFISNNSIHRFLMLFK